MPYLNDTELIIFVEQESHEFRHYFHLCKKVHRKTLLRTGMLLNASLHVYYDLLFITVWSLSIELPGSAEPVALALQLSGRVG